MVGCDSRRISFLKSPPPRTASVHVWFIWFFWSFRGLLLVTEGQVNQLVLQEVEKCSSQWSFRGFPCKKQTPILQQGRQETSKMETVFSSTPQKIKKGHQPRETVKMALEAPDCKKPLRSTPPPPTLLHRLEVHSYNQPTPFPNSPSYWFRMPSFI